MRGAFQRLRASLGATVAVAALLGMLPGPAAAATDVKAVSGTYGSACALRADGGVSCWGTNEDLQMGDGDDSPDARLTPVRVVRANGQPLTGAIRLLGGGRHFCTIQQDRTMRCWGYNSNGQLGNGTNTPIPHAVTPKVNGKPLGDVRDLALGWQHTCAIQTSGKVWCWGGNYQNSLGDGTSDDQWSPVRVRRAGGAALGGAIAISAGSYHTCVLLRDRTMRCWGENDDNELGDGSGILRPHPVTVKTSGGGPLTGVRAIGLGGETSCAIRGDARALWCWGDNSNAQVGDGTQQDAPFPARVKRGNGFMSAVRRVAPDYGHTCAIRQGAAWCWGDTDGGEVGDGTTEPRLTPVRVRSSLDAVFPTPVTWIDTSDGGSCAVKAGRAWCWGSNVEGQAGTGTKGGAVLLPHKVPVS